MTHKRALFTLLTVALGALAFIAAVNALVDPFQMLHRPLWGQPRFSTNQRYQNSGLINNYLASDDGYSTVVIGTSLDSCYNAAMVQRALGGGKALTLTVNNSTPGERRVVLERALATGKVQRVLWGVFQNYADVRADVENTTYIFPGGLYQSPLTAEGLGARAHYLLSATVLKDSMMIALGRSKWSTDPASVYDWNPVHIKGGDFERFNAPEKLIVHGEVLARGKAVIELARRGLDQAETLAYPALEKHLAAVVRRHPEVHFDLLLPPVSALAFHEFTAEELLRQMGMRLRLVRSLGTLANVRIFAFDDDWEVTGNLANYRDSTHVGYRANDRALCFMATEQRMLTQENVTVYVRGLLDGLMRYQLVSDRERSLWSAGDDTPSAASSPCEPYPENVSAVSGSTGLARSGGS